MPNKNVLEQYIRVCEQMISYFKEEIKEKTDNPQFAYVKEFTILRKLLKTEWPTAEIDLTKQEFVKNINFVGKFLDFGCGNGEIVNTRKNVTLSVGYETIPHPWDFMKDERVLLTTDKTRVEANGPYDSILLYDVLDHMDNLEENLSWIRKLCGGIVYVRTHPWSSKHATHLPKAYLHLIFTEEELIKLGHKGIHSNKLTDYRALFSNAGFKIQSEVPIIEPVSDFFKQEQFAARVIDQSGIQFIDFALV